MAVKLENMSARELNSLITQAEKRKTLLKKRKPVGAVRKRVNKLLKDEGYSLEELFGAMGAPARAPRAAKKAAGRKLGKVAPKFRNPANAKETWSGRGRQPRWLSEYTSNGRDLEEFRIKA